MFFRSKNGPQWIVAFLGNPGTEYKDTRHNAGFWTGMELASRLGVSIKRMKYSAYTEICDIAGTRVMLMMPQTYMNRSGDAVYQAARSYKIPPERVLVVADDVSLQPGVIRIRRRGSSGGQNGLKSIIMRLQSEEFPRVKIGIGAPPHVEYELSDWVLGRPKGAELRAIQFAVQEAATAVELIVSDSVEAAMNRFN